MWWNASLSLSTKETNFSRENKQPTNWSILIIS